MPLEDEEKRKLMEKIKEHRRKIWLGEVADTRLQKEKEVKKRVLQEEKELEAEPLVTRPVKRRRSKAEKEFWDKGEEGKNKLGVGFVMLVLIGLITSIAVGMLIGYLLAVFL